MPRTKTHSLEAFARRYLVEYVIIKYMLGSCFGTPKVSHEEAASAKVVSKRWPKVPFHGASAF
jgi:hypothetical protein